MPYSFFPNFFLWLYYICIVRSYSHYILKYLPFNAHLVLFQQVTIYVMLIISPHIIVSTNFD